MEIVINISGVVSGLGLVMSYWSYYFFISDWCNKEIRNKVIKIVGFIPLVYMVYLAIKILNERINS